MINEFKSGYCHNLIKKSFFISLLIGLSWGIFIWKLYLAKPRLEIHSIGAPNSTGTFLGISLIFLICHLLQKKYQILKSQILKNKELIFYFFILFLLIVAIILNGSRGMYIGLIASLSFLFIRFGKVNKNYLFLFFFVSLLLIIGILVYPELRVRILDPYSMYERFDNWYRNLQCFKINPITGAGDYNCYLDPDNLFITILSKTGIVGLISFFIMVYFYLKQFNYNKFIIAFLIFILTNGIFETTFKHEAAITFIIVSYITGYGKNSDS
ncbi:MULTISPECIES: O-antigen ligase family protein [Thermodesulfovibrio]|uniref:O-antigen ligase family protein n=1 Tax=Thermodesulfovibrio yellowstonii TaxID=28262 RepID=UPI00146F9509|nr:O-antigen ligase family protein [Thermodesulfovibrio islandicus]